MLHDLVIRPAKATDDSYAVAKLIMLTDPYIYPVGFGENGIITLSNMITNKDTVFGYNHIILALLNNQIVGQMVILKKNSAMRINPDEYISQNPTLPIAFRHMIENYCNHLLDYIDDKNEIYVACVSVLPETRGKGVGLALLEYLISNHSNNRIKLHVLAENSAAISLYKRTGFSINGEASDGYSYTGCPPLCYEMIRYTN